MSFSQFMKGCLDRSTEFYSGRIEKWNFIWQVVDTVPESVQKQFESGHWHGILIRDGSPNLLYRQGDGVFFVSGKGQSVDCENLDLWEGNSNALSVPNPSPKAPQTVNVPLSACRKCPFYRPVKAAKYSYATCAYLQEKRSKGENPKSMAAKEMLGSLLHGG